MSTPDPADELRQLFPPIMTTAHVAEMMHCTIGDVRDKVHRGEVPAMRWGQQYRFFREEVLASMKPVTADDEPLEEDEELEESAEVAS
jgi:excisionase family DNA binding protein